MTAPHVPGAFLLSRVGFASAGLICANDFWLKRHHPGIVSGKLSDVGLCVLLPLVLASLLEWAAAAIDSARRRPPRPRSWVTPLACIVAVVYFTAVKTWPWATQAHVAWLSALVRGWRFRAVSDPTDLVCLPAALVAWWTMRRTRAGGSPRVVQPNR